VRYEKEMCMFHIRVQYVQYHKYQLAFAKVWKHFRGWMQDHIIAD